MSAAAQPDQAPSPESHDGEHLYCLGLGSNIDPQVNLPYTIEFLRSMIGLCAISTAYESAAVGGVGHDADSVGDSGGGGDCAVGDGDSGGGGAQDFLNAAVLAWACLPPHLLKSQVIRGIEARLGRVRTADKNAPRQIDIDILVIDGVVVDPLLWEQAYLAVPVAELLPDLVSPVSGERLAEVAGRLRETVDIYPRPDVLSFWGAR